MSGAHGISTREGRELKEGRKLGQGGGGKPKGLERKRSRGQEGLARAHVFHPETARLHWDRSQQVLSELKVPSLTRDTCCCGAAPHLPHSCEKRALSLSITPSHIHSEAGARSRCS